MKPKDLKFPFRWEDRKPLIVDKVFFIPKYYEPGERIVLPAFFERSAPIWIEYCSGNGAWIIEKAKAHPERNWIAVEKRFERVQKIWSKMKNEKIDNLFIVCGEALGFTTHYVPSDHFEGIYINFPDPWPKARHAKHRLLQDSFIAQMARVSKRDAQAVIVTDHKEYVDRVCEEFLAHPDWTPVFPAPYFVTEWEGYGSSYFDNLWRLRGKTIHYLQFSNKMA
jgi:tRNA (guanine-N7-)-methyltransferase